MWGQEKRNIIIIASIALLISAGIASAQLDDMMPQVVTKQPFVPVTSIIDSSIVQTNYGYGQIKNTIVSGNPYFRYPSGWADRTSDMDLSLLSEGLIISWDQHKNYFVLQPIVEYAGIEYSNLTAISDIKSISKNYLISKQTGAYKWNYYLSGLTTAKTNLNKIGFRLTENTTPVTLSDNIYSVYDPVIDAYRTMDFNDILDSTVCSLQKTVNGTKNVCSRQFNLTMDTETMTIWISGTANYDNLVLDPTLTITGGNQSNVFSASGESSGDIWGRQPCLVGELSQADYNAINASDDSRASVSVNAGSNYATFCMNATLSLPTGVTKHDNLSFTLEAKKDAGITCIGNESLNLYSWNTTTWTSIKQVALGTSDTVYNINITNLADIGKFVNSTSLKVGYALRCDTGGTGPGNLQVDFMKIDYSYTMPDTAGPVINYVSPTLNNGSTRNNYIFINVTSIDAFPTNVDQVILEWNGTNQTLTKNASSQSNVFASVNKTGLAGGNYTFRVYSNDTLNNTAVSATRIVYVDLNVPVITFVNPTDANNTYTRNNTYVNFTVTDDFAINNTWINFAGVNYSIDDASIVLSYDLNNNTKDQSRYGNNGTFTNGNMTVCSASMVPGVFGGGCSFDGIDDTIQSASNVGISGAQPRTLAFWTKVNGFNTTIGVGNNGTVVLGWGNGVTNGRFDVTITYSTSNPNWYLWGHGNDWNTGSTVPLNTWQHHVITFNGTRIRWWIDGVEQGTGNNNALNTIDAKLTIGQSTSYHPTVFNSYFNGTIDEVRIYNRVLSLDEINNTQNVTFGRYINSYYFNVTNLTNANYTYYVQANDSAGNIGNSSTRHFNVYIDTFSPTITSIAVNQSYVNYAANVNVTVNATDATAISQILLTVLKPNNSTYVNNASMISNGGTGYTRNFTLDGTTEGNWTVIVYSNDTLNNSGINTTWTVIDFTKPTNSLINIGLDGFEVPNLLKVSVNMTDTYPNQSKISIQSPNGTIYNFTNSGVNKANYSLTNFTVGTNNAYGNYIIFLNASDQAGNINITNITIGTGRINITFLTMNSLNYTTRELAWGNPNGIGNNTQSAMTFNLTYRVFTEGIISNINGSKLINISQIVDNWTSLRYFNSTQTRITIGTITANVMNITTESMNSTTASDKNISIELFSDSALSYTYAVISPTAFDYLIKNNYTQHFNDYAFIALPIIGASCGGQICLQDFGTQMTFDTATQHPRYFICLSGTDFNCNVYTVGTDVYDSNAGNNGVQGYQVNMRAEGASPISILSFQANQSDYHIQVQIISGAYTTAGGGGDSGGSTGGGPTGGGASETTTTTLGTVVGICPNANYTIDPQNPQQCILKQSFSPDASLREFLKPRFFGIVSYALLVFMGIGTIVFYENKAYRAKAKKYFKGN